MAYRGRTPKELGTAKWKNTRRYIRSRDGDRCRVCEASGAIQRMYVHHILPRAQGGSDDVKNLMLVCQSCHGKLEREAKQAAAAPAKPRFAESKWLRPSEHYGPQPVSFPWSDDCYLNPDYVGES